MLKAVLGNPAYAHTINHLNDTADPRAMLRNAHQMSQAESMCDRVVMIHRGQKVLDNTPREIRDRFDPHAILLDPLRADADPALLRAVPGVAEVRRVRKQFEVWAREGVEPSTLLSPLAAAIPASRVELVRPSLEDIFIQIVRDAATTDEERASLAALQGESALATTGSDRGGD